MFSHTGLNKVNSFAYVQMSGNDLPPIISGGSYENVVSASTAVLISQIYRFHDFTLQVNNNQLNKTFWI